MHRIFLARIHLCMQRHVLGALQLRHSLYSLLSIKVKTHHCLQTIRKLCMYAYMYTYVSVYKLTYAVPACARVCMCISVCIHVHYIYIHMHVHMCTRIYIHTIHARSFSNEGPGQAVNYTYIHTYMTHIHTCIYIHRHT